MKLTRFTLLTLLASALCAQEISGSYRGTIQVEDREESRTIRGMIIVKENNGTLTVSAGPDSIEQFPAYSVQRNGSTIKFTVTDRADIPRKLTFDLTLKEDLLSGKVTIVDGDGRMRTGTLEFKKQ